MRSAPPVDTWSCVPVTFDPVVPIPGVDDVWPKRSNYDVVAGRADDRGPGLPKHSGVAAAALGMVMMGATRAIAHVAATGRTLINAIPRDGLGVFQAAIPASLDREFIGAGATVCRIVTESAAIGHRERASVPPQRLPVPGRAQ